jgi:hypothetical protein
MMPAQAPLPLLRALTVTGMILGLAATAHTAGGGGLPAPGVLALLAALVLLPVTILARRRLGLGVIAASLGAGQLALHAAFTAFPGPVDHCASSGMVHEHHQVTAVAGCMAGTGSTAMHPADLVPVPAMTAAHLAAVGLTALLLARGEAALWRMLAWLAPLTFALHVPVLSQGRQPLQRGTVFVPPLHPCLRVPALRGPPPVFPRTAEA